MKKRGKYYSSGDDSDSEEEDSDIDKSDYPSDDPPSDPSDISSNDSNYERYHPGYLDIDWDGDFWADWDEDCHGYIDTEERREEYPEGFIYSCCNQDGTSNGCQIRRIVNNNDSSDNSDNSSDGNMYHPGSLDVDWDADFWADWDEDCHGVIDTRSRRKEYPEGFIWSCCDQDGSSNGCTRR